MVQKICIKAEIDDKAWIRMGWIEASLRYAGAFGPSEKKEYARMFGVSQSTITRDQSVFYDVAMQMECQKFLTFTKGKLFIFGSGFDAVDPIFDCPEFDIWMRMFKPNAIEMITHLERSEPSPHVLRTIVRAISDRKTIWIEGRSMPGKAESRRKFISPHTIINADGRYDVRAFDHSQNTWVNLVISQIEKAGDIVPDSVVHVSKEKDSEWQNLVHVKIAAKES